MPKVSILVPIYNVERYLRQCLDSLACQTLDDIEIICINDGSTDSSLDIINEFCAKDSRFKVIDKENSGYGASMNRGLDIASGEFIGIVESDDFVKPNMFEELYSLAIKKDAEIVKSDYYYTTAIDFARKAGKISRIIANKVLNVKIFPKMLKMTPSIWSAIYKKDFIKDNKINFLETPGASYQDTSFAFKVLALAQRVVFSEKAYVYYRQDNENSSVNSKDKVFMICDEYDEITKFLNESPEIKKVTNTQKLIKQYKTYMWNLKRIDAKFKDSFIDVFSETFRKYYEDGELKLGFYLKYSKKDIQLLINDKKAFKKQVDRALKIERIKARRRKLFSIHINFSRVSIVLFGKQIIELE